MDNTVETPNVMLPPTINELVRTGEQWTVEALWNSVISSVTPEGSRMLNDATVDQSKSDLLKTHRQYRVTGTTMHSVRRYALV